MSLNDARKVYLISPYPKLTSMCIIDSHMHFMSGRTTPMPLLWNQGLFGKRVFIEWLASSLIMKWFLSRFIGKLQKQDILESKRGPGIAAAVLEQHNKVFHPEKNRISFFKEYLDTEYLTFMIALMMDMEYACIDGYRGKMVYYRSKERTYVYKSRHDDGSFEEKEVRGKERDLFYMWDIQLKQTERAIESNPWRFLSLYHYDPRRWNHPLSFKPDKSQPYWFMVLPIFRSRYS